VLITGQGGTGKSFLVKIIIKHLRTKVNKKVAIVCSTGIAATNYTEFGAKTLHKWSGIEDGRHLDEELIHLVKTDERFLSAKNNIETVQTLIVDEISMIGAKVLNQDQFQAHL
jgi:ATP-dependent exoDNAse (exonuclease V) alpha subunit